MCSYTIWNCKVRCRKYGTLQSLTLDCTIKSLYTLLQKNLTFTFFSCISNSVQPLTVHCHWLYWVQPYCCGTRNTAKSCTGYSQNICSVQDMSNEYSLTHPLLKFCLREHYNCICILIFRFSMHKSINKEETGLQNL